MEKYVAVFDVGTTTVKGVLIDKNAEFFETHSIPIETMVDADGKIEQNPLDWWHALKAITATWWRKQAVLPEQIEMITFSGQMEDVIPVLESKNPHPAILYSDTRAGVEADQIRELARGLEEKTGNTISATTPLAKLLWMKTYETNLFAKMKKVLFSSKDFLIHKLADVYVTDPTTASTTGMMNHVSRQWEKDLIENVGFDREKLPEIKSSEEIAGYVTLKAEKEIGFKSNTPVLCGAGDGGATAVGAGAVCPGDAYGYVGTTGWLAVIGQEIRREEKLSDLFHLAHLPQERMVRIIPLLNAGNVYSWAVQTFAAGDYTEFEKLIRQSEAGSNGVLFLPYLNGERNPVNDADAKGAFWGLTQKTEAGDLARAVTEGIAFSLKQLSEYLGLTREKEFKLIGGVTKSSVFVQILADCLNQTISIPKDSEFMPSIGAASSAFIRLGWARNYQDFTDRFINQADPVVYQPIDENVNSYKKSYKQFIKLYPSMNHIYQ